MDRVLTGDTLLRSKQAGCRIVVVGGETALQQTAMGLLIVEAVASATTVQLYDQRLQ